MIYFPHFFQQSDVIAAGQPVLVGPEAPTVSRQVIIVEKLRHALHRPTASLRHRADCVLRLPIAMEAAVSASRARREERRPTSVMLSC